MHIVWKIAISYIFYFFVDLNYYEMSLVHHGLSFQTYDMIDWQDISSRKSVGNLPAELVQNMHLKPDSKVVIVVLEIIDFTYIKKQNFKLEIPFIKE